VVLLIAAEGRGASRPLMDWLAPELRSGSPSLDQQQAEIFGLLP
jgi:hypothetical protein